MNEQQLSDAAERLAAEIRTLPLSDPLLRHLDAAAPEFLRSRGFDISTRPGCIAALRWLGGARVEEVFWKETGEEGAVDNAADFYLAEARLDGLRRVVEERLKLLTNEESGL